jgi:membrane protein
MDNKMMKKSRLQQGREFLLHGLWEADPVELRAGKRFLLKSLQFVMAVGREFFADNCLLHASALAFTTILSFIPFLAVMFALLKGFGAETNLEILILNHLALGSEEVVDTVFTYISNTNLAKLGIFGVVSLLLTVLTLLNSIEKSFNHIWRVKETRSFSRLFADYLSIIIFGPILILAAISMTTTFESQGLVRYLIGMEVVGAVLLALFKIFPYLAMWAVFTGLYLFMPNTRISLRAALLGGAFGGILWQLLQWGYVTFQFGVTRNNAIYGTMAALPVFMIWIYISWVIVLLGLEITFAIQNFRTIRQEFRGDKLSSDGREAAALAILLAAAAAFIKGDKPLTVEDFSLRLNLSHRFTQQSLSFLVHCGFLNEVAQGKDALNAYQPAIDVSSLPLHEVLQRMRLEGEELKLIRMGSTGRVVDELQRTLLAAQASALAGVTLRELAARMGGGDAGLAVRQGD